MTAGGFVEPDAVEDMVSDDVVLVSVMAANSETGVLNPVGEIAERVRAAGALFHCDATQMAGRLPFDMEELGADLVSVSGHKICGPGGVGALVGTRHALQRLAPVIHGGGHERGLRSGSLNVGGIVGLGTAARIAADERESESARVKVLRDRLVAELGAKLAGMHQNGDRSRRLPNTASIRFEGADAEAVMSNMDPVAVSTGSACSAGSIEPSEVLTAMGLSRDAAFESVRFSLGRFTVEADIDAACGERRRRRRARPRHDLISRGQRLAELCERLGGLGRRRREREPENALALGLVVGLRHPAHPLPLLLGRRPRRHRKVQLEHEALGTKDRNELHDSSSSSGGRGVNLPYSSSN